MLVRGKRRMKGGEHRTADAHHVAVDKINERERMYRMIVSLGIILGTWIFAGRENRIQQRQSKYLFCDEVT
jgi:hypothetical protein